MPSMAPLCHDHSPDSFNVRPFYAAAVENGITGCAAAINYKMFLDCAAALSSKKADENLLPSLAVILSAAALGARLRRSGIGCGISVRLAADLIAPEKKKRQLQGIQAKGADGRRIFAGAGLVVLLAWMIVTV